MAEPIVPTPPIAAVRPIERTFHGETLVDNYAWLRHVDDPAVIAYLEAENAYLAEATRHFAPLRDQLAAEMRARLNEVDATAPEPEGEFFYYTRTVAGKQYPLHCRRRAGPSHAPEELLIDENALAEGFPFFTMGMVRVSPDGRLLAYSVDTNGSETFDLHVVEIASGARLAGPIPYTYYSLEWASDSRTLYYSTLDAAKRPERLWRSVVGADPATAELLYDETDAMFNVQLRKTSSGEWLVLLLESNTTVEVRLLRADAPAGAFALALPRRHRVEYRVQHHGDDLYLLTNDGAPNFRLVRAPLADPAPAHWEEIVAHRDEVLIEAFAMFSGHIALFERAGGLQRIAVIDLASMERHEVAFDEPAYSIWADEQNRVFDTATLRFSYSSLITPTTAFDYDMRTRTRHIVKQETVPGYDAARYRTERIWARAADGVMAPVTLAYRADLRRAGGNPTFLRGYGAYGATSDPYFEQERISLLDRGVVVALAHIRGGGELGRGWYEQGKFLNKRNTYTDFIACAEHLIAAGYTATGRLAIKGRSAGGLLMGAVVTMRPDLFGCVIAGVPAVDLINTMSDPSIPLVVSEYEEWGNPADPQQYAYMRSYSPYEHTTARDYPAMLVTGAIHDPRVVFWEPAKWVARLRAVKTDSNLLLLKTDMIGGHSGASGRYDRIDETAFEYAFVLSALQV
jgi:oligopeptidase B